MRVRKEKEEKSESNGDERKSLHLGDLGRKG